MDAVQVTTLSGLIAAEWAQATAAAAAFAPYLLIVAAIAAVVAAIVLLVKNWDAVKEKCIEVAQIIGEKWHEISTAKTIYRKTVNGLFCTFWGTSRDL